MKNYTLIALLFVLVAMTAASYPAQILKTSLQITILDELGNPVEGAEVELYSNEDDYNASKNPATPKLKTDKKGRVTFKDLDTIVYYVNAEKEDLSNDGAGAKTGELVARRINKVNIIIS